MKAWLGKDGAWLAVVAAAGVLGWYVAYTRYSVVPETQLRVRSPSQDTSTTQTGLQHERVEHRSRNSHKPATGERVLHGGANPPGPTHRELKSKAPGARKGRFPRAVPTAEGVPPIPSLLCLVRRVTNVPHCSLLPS